MTEDQETHLRRVQQDFCILSDLKYRKGQKEHGGSLWEKSPTDLLDDALLEAIDQVVYLLTLRDRLKEVIDENEKLTAENNAELR